MRRATILLSVLMAIALIGAACSRMRSDEAIANEIKAKMFSDAQLKGANLTITAQNGEVTLSGEVPSDAARYQAFKLASETPGVKKINDQMSVKVAQAEAPPPQPAAEPEPAPRPAPKRKAVQPAAPPAVREEAAAPPPPPPAQPAATQPIAPVTPPEPKPVVVEIPAGTRVTVIMIDSVDSEVNRTGEVFRASLDEPIVVNQEIVVPTGADVFVKLVEARTAGRLSGRSELRLELQRMVFQDKTYQLESSTYEQVGASRGKRTAATIGAGAAIGAAIGAIAGGGKGAAIGAGVGAGGGTAVQVLTKGKQVRVPSETRLEFRLEAPVTVTYMPGKSKTRE